MERGSSAAYNIIMHLPYPYTKLVVEVSTDLMSVCLTCLCLSYNIIKDFCLIFLYLYWWLSAYSFQLPLVSVGLRNNLMSLKKGIDIQKKSKNLLEQFKDPHRTSIVTRQCLCRPVRNIDRLLKKKTMGLLLVKSKCQPGADYEFFGGGGRGQGPSKRQFRGNFLTDKPKKL